MSDELKAPIKGYKAFKQNMTCRGFQYEEGKIYKTDKAEFCSMGFHLCTNPLDILDYYDLIGSRFHEVEALGELSLSQDNVNTKCATTKIKIGAKLSLKMFVEASFDFLWKICSGNSSQLAASGNSSKLAASGNSSQLELNGQHGVGTNIGVGGKIKGKKGNWVTLAEWKYDKKESRWVPFCVQSTKIDGKKIKEDVLYKLKNGRFVEVK